MSLNSDKLRPMIEGINDLPTLPTVVSRIISQIANPATNAADIGKLIEQDQALTSKVLRLVNSAYYGFPKQIKSIQHAVVILGFNKVKTVTTTAAVFDLIRQRDCAGLDLRRFWQHALGSAIASKVTAEYIGIGHSAEDAFIGGLLHDLGKVVLDQFQHQLYAPVLQYARDKGILLTEAEDEVLGLNHTQIGEWVMEKWRLPQVIVCMVRHHHSPNNSPDRREMVNAVHMGDILVRALGVGNGGDNRIPAIDPATAASHMIDAALLREMVDTLVAEIAKAEDFFALVSGDGGD